jgi:hypothetical protein
MSATTNRYAGACDACGQLVPALTGRVEGVTQGRRARWRVWCLECFNRSDNSSDEDRQCGDRAYEDACAERCGL